MSGVRRDGSVSPMLSGAFTEWSPALGESWHVVQVPVNGSGTVTPFGNVWLLRPATPEMTIDLVLKICCPRAIARRELVVASRPFRLPHASKMVKAFGSNAAPVGFRPTGSLMPVKNGCRASTAGPPPAPSARSDPASRSRAWAVNRPVSNATIAAASWSDRCAADCACPVVASSACLARSWRMLVVGDDSRPSHMTALRNPRLVDGSGRRYIDAEVSGAWH